MYKRLNSHNVFFRLGEVKALIESDGKETVTTPLIEEDGYNNMRSTDPVFDIFIRCNKRTSLNYGPWADR